MSYFNSKKISDLLTAKEIKPLESEYDIEELVIASKSFEEKIKFFENLKKKRAQDIDEEIGKIQNKIDMLKYIITLTLESTNKKSLAFPRTCKVSMSDRKGKWIIDQESDLLNMISKEIDKDEYDRIVQSKVVYSKREIDSILDKWESGGKVPSCVHKEPSTKSLKITFSGESIVSFDEDECEISVSKDGNSNKVGQGSKDGIQEKNIDMDNLDGINF